MSDICKYDELLSARLIAVTQPIVDNLEDASELIAYCARVSNPSNQNNMDTAAKLIAYLKKYRHWSPFEMANAVVEITCTRDIVRQLLRHRSFSFQEFCISGESKITLLTEGGNSYKLPISDLYARCKSTRWGRSDNLVRVYDEASKTLKPAKIREVFNTGIKPVFKLTLENGKVIKATEEHKFLTQGGFKKLMDISCNDFVACNGVEVYKQAEWMAEAKQRNIHNGKGLQGIAEDAGVSYHTVRKWLKIMGMSFSKSEVAQYTQAWNKGLPKEQQPRYGQTVSEQTRTDMIESSRKGERSNLYKGAYRTWRKNVADFWNKRKRQMFLECGGVCAIRGIQYNESELEIDHLKQVALHPELAYDVGNVRLIHKEEHRKKTFMENPKILKVPSYHKVMAIEFVGDEQTYDIEVEHTSHNYVANGIVTHNSQRYASVESLGEAFCLREARLQDTKNRQNSLEVTGDDEDSRFIISEWYRRQQEVINLVEEHYKWAVQCGIAKECARVILPEGNTMSRVYVNGTIRSWIHYFEVRMEEGVTQKEHVMIASLIAEQVAKAFPVLKG